MTYGQRFSPVTAAPTAAEVGHKYANHAPKLTRPYHERHQRTQGRESTSTLKLFLTGQCSGREQRKRETHTHTHTHTNREKYTDKRRERERETHTHTHTHTHTQSSSGWKSEDKVCLLQGF